MSPLAAILTLTGLVGVPAALLWGGRNFRSFGDRALEAYRGAVIGYGVAALGVATALIAPPHVWPLPPGFGRTALATALLLGPALGAGVGAWRASSDA
jgi:hypothetical protein